MTVIISAKGQVVIPAEIRKRYKLAPNSKVDVLDTGHSIVIVPLPKGDPFLASRGILKGKFSTEEFLLWRRQRKRIKAMRGFLKDIDTTVPRERDRV